LVAILVLTAVELEARALARALSLPSLPSLSFPAFGRGAIRVAPVGLRAGLLGSRWTALVSGSDRPLVVSAGVCGGLDPALRAGDLVLPDAVINDGGRRLPVTGSVAHRSTAAGGAPARTGLMVTVTRVVATPEAKAALRAATGAVAVDMESAAILDAAAARGCSSLVVRAVSDDACETLPDELMRLMGTGGRIRCGGVLLALARPRVLHRALQLRRSTRRALASVAGSLARLAA
jgi:adenosylhomocysteine nucleosidase